jgi:hypothetical protein
MASDADAPDAERRRPAEADAGSAPRRRWGPYLSERPWGTVREDCSPDGDAWSYVAHDQARSRACRWGEDGTAGVSDDEQGLRLVLGKGRDPIGARRRARVRQGTALHTISADDRHRGGRESLNPTGDREEPLS